MHASIALERLRILLGIFWHLIEFDTGHNLLVLILMSLVPLLLLHSGEFHLGYKKSDVQGISWYQMLHWDSTKEAQAKHRLSEYSPFL